MTGEIEKIKRLAKECLDKKWLDPDKAINNPCSFCLDVEIEDKFIFDCERCLCPTILCDESTDDDKSLVGLMIKDGEKLGYYVRNQDVFLFNLLIMALKELAAEGAIHFSTYQKIQFIVAEGFK